MYREKGAHVCNESNGDVPFRRAALPGRTSDLEGFMNLQKLTPLLVALLVLMVANPSDAVAAPAVQKICLNPTTGALTSRAKCRRSETALSLSALTASITERQGLAGSQLCLDSTSGSLASRAKCQSSETVLSLAGLTAKVTEQQGPDESPFFVNFSPGHDVDVVIPAAVPLPGGFGGVVAGTLGRTATCPSGLVHAASCESSNLANVSVSGGVDADGKSYRCSWSNFATQAKTGRYFVKVVCAEF